MKHIILAAGMGSRLFPLTLTTPKVLLPIAGTTLLANQIAISLRMEAIEHILVVTGFKSQIVHEYLSRTFGENPKITSVFNPDFTINNPVYSLARAVTATGEDWLITNGDVYYHQSLIRRLLETATEGITMVVSPYRDRTNRAMTVHIHDERMVAIYPHAPERNAYESPGIVIVRGAEAQSVFYTAMQSVYRRFWGQPHYWHEILNYAKGELPINIQMISEESWGEVDVKEDLAVVDKLGRSLHADEI